MPCTHVDMTKAQWSDTVLQERAWASLYYVQLNSRQTRERTVRCVEDERQHSVILAVLPAVANERVEVVETTDGHRHVSTTLTADQEVEVRRRLLGRRARKIELDAGERKPERHSSAVDTAVSLDRQRRRRHRHSHVHRRETFVLVLSHLSIPCTRSPTPTLHSTQAPCTHRKSHQACIYVQDMCFVVVIPAPRWPLKPAGLWVVILDSTHVGLSVIRRCCPSCKMVSFTSKKDQNVHRRSRGVAALHFVRQLTSNGKKC